MALETSAKTAYNVNDLFVAIGIIVFKRLFFDYHLTVAAARKLPKQQQPAANAQPTVEPGVSGCFFEAFFSSFFLFLDTAFQAAASKGKSGCC